MFDVASEIIAFLAMTLGSEDRGGPAKPLETRRYAIEQASELLRRDKDAVALVFDLFEGELYRNGSGRDDQNSVDFLTNCMDFLRAVLPLDPQRVWTFLRRSRLLGLEGSESRLVSAIAKLEMPVGRYRLLSSSLRLYEALILDAVALHPKSQNSSTALTRFGHSASEFE